MTCDGDGGGVLRRFFSTWHFDGFIISTRHKQRRQQAYHKIIAIFEKVTFRVHVKGYMYKNKEH